MRMNRSAFFAEARQSLFRGRFSQSQVNGINILLDTWESDYGAWPQSMLAYCLATAKHETADTMQPIEEYGGDARAERLYGPRGSNPSRAKKMGNTQPGDGARYKGRGFVQLTWMNNYHKAGDKIGVDLVSQPDMAMNPDIAAHVLFKGCLEGWFTGKKLPDYMDASRADFRNARKVVNGLDKAQLIAGYAHAFEEAIEAGLEAPQEPERPGVPAPPPPITGKETGKSSTILTALGGILTAIGGVIGSITDALGPWPTVVLFALIIGGAIYIITERRRHAHESGI